MHACKHVCMQLYDALACIVTNVSLDTCVCVRARAFGVQKAPKDTQAGGALRALPDKDVIQRPLDNCGRPDGNE